MTSRSASRIFAVSLATGLLLVSIGVSLFLEGYSLITRYGPWVDAAMEIKLEATYGHLWFEEIASGDRSETMEDVRMHLDEAQWYIEAMLLGGQNQEGTFLPVDDPEITASLISVQQSLAKFRQIAEQRYKNLDQSTPGSPIDVQFDAIFDDYISVADHAETMIQNHIRTEVRTYQYLGLALIILSLLITIVVSSFMARREQRRIELMSSIAEKNEIISVKNKELENIAFHDQLTGLPNRYIFDDRVNQAIAQARRNHDYFAVLFVDLDHFKNVNDQYGHDNGDRLIKETAARLKSCVREEDSVMRISGDEFIVILSSIDDQDDAVNSSRLVAMKLLDALRAPYHILDMVLHVTASIGIAIYPNDGGDASALIRHSDSAMYHAKGSGKDNYQFFSEELNTIALERLKIEQDLRNAVDAEEFYLVYQPQWDIQSKTIRGAEALIRWNRTDGQMIGPDRFIPVAESCGLISSIDRFVLKSAFKQCKDWQDQGVALKWLSINISAIHFRQKTFVQEVMTLLNETGIDGGFIELEITESALLENFEQAAMTIKTLNKLGISIAIDDFGTGYSSLSYLHKLNFQTIKVDRQFVSNVADNEASQQVLRSILGLAKGLGAYCIIEGIETDREADFLINEGCNLGQGYLVSKPVAPTEFEALLASDDVDNVYRLGQSPDE